MLKKWFLIALGLFMTVLVMLWLQGRKYMPSDQTVITIKEAQPLVQGELKGLEVLRQETQRRLAEMAAKIPKKQEQTNEGTENSHEKRLYAAAQFLGPTFTTLYEQRDYFDKQVIEEEIFKQLAEDPVNLHTASRALSDPHFLYEAFGAEQQAVARVYAIKFLSHEAAAGDPLPLIETTRHLYESLSLYGEKIKGQYLDMESLMIEQLSLLYERDELLEKGGEVLLDLLSTEDNRLVTTGNQQLIEAIQTAFNIMTVTTSPRERIKEMLQSVGQMLHQKT